MTSVRPGSTATSMPITRPITSTMKLMGVKTVAKPPARLASTSIASAHADRAQQRQRQPLERPFAERQRDVGHAHEDHDQREASRDRHQPQHDGPAIAADPGKDREEEGGGEEETQPRDGD